MNDMIWKKIIHEVGRIYVYCHYIISTFGNTVFVQKFVSLLKV